MRWAKKEKMHILVGRREYDFNEILIATLDKEICKKKCNLDIFITTYSIMIFIALL